MDDTFVSALDEAFGEVRMPEPKHEAFPEARMPEPKRQFGIPTLYKGVRFRSRGEARWAAFFDQLEWPWAYEPLDLAGYIPDFVLHFEHNGEPAPVLVEVKPALFFSELKQHAPKIESSGWAHNALIVGAELFSFGTPKLTPFAWYRNTGKWMGALPVICPDCSKFSLLPEYKPASCAVCGHTPEGQFQWPFGLKEKWAATGNTVQWKPGPGLAQEYESEATLSLDPEELTEIKANPATANLYKILMRASTQKFAEISKDKRLLQEMRDNPRAAVESAAKNLRLTLVSKDSLVITPEELGVIGKMFERIKERSSESVM